MKNISFILTPVLIGDTEKQQFIFMAAIVTMIIILFLTATILRCKKNSAR
jgi:hypothetical protein